MWLLSHEGGVNPVIAIDWNKRCSVSWNAWDICLSIRPGTPFGPAALWDGVRRKASCMMAGVMHPTIIGAESVGTRWMRLIQVKGAPGGSEGSGDKATVSKCESLVITSSRAVMRRPAVSSRSIERSLGKEELSDAAVAARIMDFSATLIFVRSIRSRALPYRNRRMLRAWRMSSRVALLGPLNTVWNWEGVESTSTYRSCLLRNLTDAMSLGRGGGELRAQGEDSANFLP